MSKEKKIVELNKKELESVTGGTTTQYQLDNKQISAGFYWKDDKKSMDYDKAYLKKPIE